MCSRNSCCKQTPWEIRFLNKGRASLQCRIHSDCLISCECGRCTQILHVTSLVKVPIQDGHYRKSILTMNLFNFFLFTDIELKPGVVVAETDHFLTLWMLIYFSFLWENVSLRFTNSNLFNVSKTRLTDFMLNIHCVVNVFYFLLNWDTHQLLFVRLIKGTTD